MKRFILVVLLLSVTMAYDIRTTAIYEIKPNGEDYAHYTEVYQHDWQDIMDNWLNSVNDSFDVVSRRAGMLVIDNYSIYENSSALLISFNGRIKGISKLEANSLLVGSVGFVDSICQRLQPESIRKVRQRFEFTAEMPKGYYAIKIPLNHSAYVRPIYYSYGAWVENRTTHWFFDINVSDSNVMDYCKSRQIVEKIISQKFVLKNKKDDAALLFIWSLAVLILAVLAYENYKKRKKTVH
ncbi:hypothetical protein DRN74_02245 [Candidatus Micrarchaeota archaeon]|nr:MAG: hypothetical protein DRN74_02245 [Candidatus Micrarchaeota archaeon]